MAYFMYKNKIITRAITTKSNKYSPKWSVVRRIATTRFQQQIGQNGRTSNTTVTSSPGGSTTTTGGNSSNKGKGKLLYFKRKWSWKAGAGWTILSVLDWWLLAAGGWLTWQGLFLRWTPIGLCVVAAVQWHLYNDLEKKRLPRTATPWQMNMYCSLPLRLMSRGWGWIADCRVPTPFRSVVYGAYSTAFGVNLNEAKSPDFKNYRSLSEFFARALKDGVRTIDSGCLVSPCDGKVLHIGTATNSQIEQVKGVTYNIEEFLGPSTWAPHKIGGQYVDCIKESPEKVLYQCIIYLAPGDYHRFHSPATWQPSIRRHFSGELLSVSPKIAQWVPGLFCLNERALYIGKWKHGFFSFTAVGATNVGSVQIYMDEKLQTNRWMGWKISHRHSAFEELQLADNAQLRKGDLVGQFNMGSTIVLIFEAPKDFNFSVMPGETIKMGEKLGCLD